MKNLCVRACSDGVCVCVCVRVCVCVCVCACVRVRVRVRLWVSDIRGHTGVRADLPTNRPLGRRPRQSRVSSHARVSVRPGQCARRADRAVCPARAAAAAAVDVRCRAVIAAVGAARHAAGPQSGLGSASFAVWTPAAPPPTVDAMMPCRVLIECIESAGVSEGTPSLSVVVNPDNPDNPDQAARGGSVPAGPPPKVRPTPTPYLMRVIRVIRIARLRGRLWGGVGDASLTTDN